MMVVADLPCSLESTSDASAFPRNKLDDCKSRGISPPLFVCAPMVRYSKLPFRKLVQRFGCDLAYTPMIYAKDFVTSEKCRLNEFTTDDSDWPIAQFAAKVPSDFAAAAELVQTQVRGIDLNCGCPKSDVRSEGFGSKLLEDPELIADIVSQTRNRIQNPDFSISVKIRIRYPLEETVDMCRKFEAAGVTHIAVHGRTVSQRAETPDYDAIALVKSAVHVPVFANGGCRTYDQALDIAERTKADGVMVGEGLLTNPALFAGFPTTPPSCVRDWFQIATDWDVRFTYFHRHTAFMTEKVLSKPQRMELQKQSTIEDTIGFVSDLLPVFE